MDVEEPGCSLMVEHAVTTVTKRTNNKSMSRVLSLNQPYYHVTLAMILCYTSLGCVGWSPI